MDNSNTDISSIELLKRLAKMSGVNEKLSKEEKLKIFGNNLRKLREHAGLTKKAVSSAVGIIPQQYYRYEDGISEPGVIMASKLASLYGVDVQDLFVGIDDKKERISRAVRELNELGIKAEMNLAGEVSAEIIGPQPVHIPIDDIEKLIEISLNNIKPSIQTNFASELAKNFLLHLSQK